MSIVGTGVVGSGGSGGGGTPDPNTVLAVGTLTVGKFLQGAGDTHTEPSDVSPDDIQPVTASLSALPDISFSSIRVPVYSPEGDVGEQIGYITIADILEAFRYAKLDRLDIKAPDGTDNPLLQLKFNGGGADSRYDVQAAQWFTSSSGTTVAFLLYVEPGQLMTLNGEIVSTRIGGIANVENRASCQFEGHVYRDLGGILTYGSGVYFNKNPLATNLTYGIGDYISNYAYFSIGGLDDHDFVHDFNIRSLKGSSLAAA